MFIETSAIAAENVSTAFEELLNAVSEVRSTNHDQRDSKHCLKLNDPELQKELDATELRAIKDKDVRFNKDVGAWTNGFYEKYNLGEAHKIRSQVRKEAGKLIKDKDQLNKFMRAKSYEEYTAGPYEKILHKLKDPNYRKEKKNNM